MTRSRPDAKVEIPAEKSAWRPSLLPGPLALVSSLSSQGDFHAARKTWLTMVATAPPMLALCCHLAHRTAINILETREFVVNIPGEDLLARVWSAGDTVDAALEEEPPGWRFIPALKVRAPRVADCRGHIECELDGTRRLNDEEIMFFARIVSVSVDASLIRGAPEQRYSALRSLLYLEPDLYTVVAGARKIPG